MSPQILRRDRIQRMWNRPRPAAAVSYLPRCKGRRRAPRGAHGEERAVGAALPALRPAALRVAATPRPHLAGPSGAGTPQSAGRRAPTHADVGPAQSSPSSQSRHSGPSAGSLRPPTSGSENPRGGRPFPSSRPQSGEVSQPAGVARAPTCEQEDSGVRPREPDPPSLGGTWAPGTAGRSRAYMFVQRRLHLAASLISGCGLR